MISENDQQLIRQRLSYFGPELLGKLLETADIAAVPGSTEILHEGQYIRSIPIVIEGLVKVTTRHDNRELLLYYIRPFESCIMSFSAALKNEPGRIYAATEEDSRVLLIPVDKILHWVGEYPHINTLFYDQYNVRYLDLLDTIHQLLFNKMDQRLMDYFKEKVKVTGKNPVVVSHREIAGDLGTAREVVTRILRKLEKNGQVRQLKDSIEIL